jgi:hypothetical protein
MPATAVGFWSRLRLAPVVAALLCIAGCVSGVPVSIENGSGKPLTSVVVSGAGFKETIGVIAPGATETIYVRPNKETTVRVSFVIDEQRYSGESEAVENDTVNRIDAKINADLQISIGTNSR